VCPSHLLEVVDEHELGEVMADRGAREMLAGREPVAGCEIRFAELVMHVAARHPRPAPVAPGGQASGDILEVGQRNAIGNQARRPVRERGLQLRIGHRVVSPARQVRIRWNLRDASCRINQSSTGICFGSNELNPFSAADCAAIYLGENPNAMLHCSTRGCRNRSGY
jgi:hypothetical protein